MTNYNQTWMLTQFKANFTAFWLCQYKTVTLNGCLVIMKNLHISPLFQPMQMQVRLMELKPNKLHNTQIFDIL